MPKGGKHLKNEAAGTCFQVPAIRKVLRLNGRVHMGEEALPLCDQSLSLLLVDHRAIDLGAKQQRVDLAGDAVSLAAEARELVLKRLVGRVAGAVACQRRRRDLQRVEPELSDRGVELLVDLAEPDERRVVRAQALGKRARVEVLEYHPTFGGVVVLEADEGHDGRPSVGVVDPRLVVDSEIEYGRP